MITPPLSIWARPFLVAQVEIAGVTFDTLTSDDRARVAIAGRLDSGVLARTERRRRHVARIIARAPRAPSRTTSTGVGTADGPMADWPIRSWAVGKPRCYGASMPPRPRTQRPTLDLGAELEAAVQRNEFGLEY